MRGTHLVLSRPRALWAGSAALGALGILAIALGGLPQPAYGVCCVVAGLGPWVATSTGKERSQFMAYIVFAWSVFGLMPLVTIGEALGGPYGGSPWLFALGVLVALGRLVSFSHPQTKSWFMPRV